MQQTPLVLTGFGPFGEVTDNPSLRIVQALAGEQTVRHKLCALELPVSWQRAWQLAAAQVQQVGAQSLLHVGVAERALRPRLECKALNLLQFRLADNDGLQPLDGPVVAQAPAELRARPHAAGLHRALVAQGWQLDLSDDAGRYVCNATLFQSLHNLEHIHVQFLHVPLPNQEWSLQNMQQLVVALADLLP